MPNKDTTEFSKSERDCQIDSMTQVDRMDHFACQNGGEKVRGDFGGCKARVDEEAASIVKKGGRRGRVSGWREFAISPS